MRLRRSIAWVHADETRTRTFADSCCDCICFDLEDSIPQSLKAKAREEIVRIFKTVNFKGKERIVRVNSFDSPEFRKDMDGVIAKVLPDAIRLPKCEHREDVLKVDAELAEIEKANGLEPNSIEIIAMIESPLGVTNGYEIASACKRVTALSIGMEDMALLYHVTRRYTDNERDMLYVRQKMINDAKSAGIQALDCIMLIFGEIGLQEKQMSEAYQWGFDGRSCSTVEQCELANRVFRPTDEQIAAAREKVAIAKDFYENCDNVDLSNMDRPMWHGRVICGPSYDGALRTVELADQILKAEAERKAYQQA